MSGDPEDILQLAQIPSSAKARVGFIISEQSTAKSLEMLNPQPKTLALNEQSN